MSFGIFNKKTAADLNNQGVAHWKKTKFDDAIRDFDKSIEIDPRYAFAWSNKGGVLNDLHKYDEALFAVDKAIEIDPQLAFAWVNKGNALRNQGKFDDALQAVERAIELDPNLAAAQNVRNLIQKKQGVKPEPISKNIAKILERRGLSSNDVLIAAEGANGQICLTDKGVIIGREGLGNKMLVGFR